MWQVTCECGWRMKGTKGEIIDGLQHHARTAHARELSEAEVMSVAVELNEG